MRFVRNSFSFRIVAILLSLLFFQSDLFVHAGQGKYDYELELVKSEYLSGNYPLIIEKLEGLLNEVGEEYRIVRGKFFLLLGAAYERTGEKEKAIENYLIGDLLLDSPVVEGIDLRSLKIFKENVLGKTINGHRMIEKIGKRKRKKKFPILVALGAVALVVTIFLLMKKRSKSESQTLSEKYANEVFNSIEWIEIPGGSFEMGDNYGLGSDDELPVHRVSLVSYKIAKFEITNEQYEKFVKSSRELEPYFSGSEGNHPVVNVGYGDVNVFCSWLSQSTGKTIKLPTEAEWEKAARGNSQTIYPWGNAAPDCSRTNFNNCVGSIQPVGSYPSDISVFGIMDMGGNVAEITADAYLSDYYSISPALNPQGPGFNGNDNSVVRGGSWSSNDVRATNRSYINIYSRNGSTGFRVVWIDY